MHVHYMCMMTTRIFPDKNQSEDTIDRSINTGPSCVRTTYLSIFFVLKLTVAIKVVTNEPDKHVEQTGVLVVHRTPNGVKWCFSLAVR